MGLLDYLKIGGGFALGAGLLFLYGTYIYGPLQHHAGVTEGKKIERAVWEEASRKKKAEQDAKLAAAQAAIDQIAKDYRMKSVRDKMSLTQLKSELDQLKQETPNASSPSGTCGPTVPDSVWRTLGGIGR